MSSLRPLAKLRLVSDRYALCISQADFNKTTTCNMIFRLSVPIDLPKYEPAS
jgi:hypothetical protein